MTENRDDELQRLYEESEELVRSRRAREAEEVSGWLPRVTPPTDKEFSQIVRGRNEFERLLRDHPDADAEERRRLWAMAHTR